MGVNEYKKRIKNTFNRQALKDFWNKQGFYIILFICVCAIGATAFWTTGDREWMQEGAKDDIQDNDQLAQEEPVQQADASDKVNIRIKDAGKDNQGQEEQKREVSQPQADKVDHGEDKSTSTGDKLIPVNATGYDKPKVADVAKAAQAQKASKALLQKPVNGSIIMDFALDHLQYSRTLKEWTTHSGIDIESPLGTPVRAVLDGVVESIEEDSLMGIIITIDHGNGLKTRYANLSTKDMVRLNQQVKKGQVISGVGRTAISEILDSPHLHFEVLKDGKNVDPKDYLE